LNNKKEAILSLPGLRESILDSREKIIEFCKNFSNDKKLLFRLELILEEILLNIADYGYTDIKGDIVISLSDEDKYFILSVTDHGIPFNPVSQKKPDTNLSIEERKPGGLGIFFIKKFSDSIEYKRKENQNILRLTLNKENKNV